MSSQGHGPTNDPESRRSGSGSHVVRDHWGALAIAILIPWAWLAVLRVLGLPDGENSHDAYYHATMGDLGPAVCMARRFPALTLSLWSEHFSDKELLFHLLVGLLRWPRRLLLDRQPPFHLAQLVFAGGVVAAFAAAAWRLGARRLWPWTLLLVVLSPFFTHRLLMLRPHLLAVILMFAAVAVAAWTDAPRRLWAMAAVGFVFAWSYSNPHFVLLPALAFAAVNWRDRRAVAVGLPLAAVGGVILGFLVHPQAPYTFVNWKIQCLDVPLAALRGPSAVYLGTELGRPSLVWLARNAGVYVLLAAAAVTAWRRPQPAATRAVVLMALVAGLGTFAGLRAMEYAAPFTVLAAALVWRDRQPDWRAATAGAAVVLVGLGFFHVDRLRASRVRPLTGLQEWASSRMLPPDAVIANPNWSDFPLLFHALPDNRFLLGIDPMFAYVHRPETVARLEAFRTGQVRLTPQELGVLTNARLAFVSHYGKALSRDLYEAGWVIVYQGPDGWLFDLTRHRPPPAKQTE